MAYQSLYLKYRPTTFEGLVGQQHVARTLQNAVASGRVSHAYLFTGPRGTGKTTAARILARALNCEKGPTPNPCGQCGACRRIMHDACLDVVEVDAASRRKVEEMSELLNSVGFLPAEVRTKVYVIDEVHMLSAHAFNALLKTLEEPPPHVVFVLATTEVHKVPATIVSRCQRFDFRRIGLGDLLRLLGGVSAQEGIAAENDALDFLAEAADGSARDAITLLEQAASYSGNQITLNDVIFIVGATEEGPLEQFVTAAAQGDVRAGMELVERQMMLGKDAALLLQDLAEYLRDCLLVTLGGEPRRYLKAQPGKSVPVSTDKEALMEAVEVVQTTAEELRLSSQHRLLCELAFIRMSEALRRREPVAKDDKAEPQMGGMGLTTGKDERSGQAEGWERVTEALERDKAIPLLQLAADAKADLDDQGRLVLTFGYQFSKEEFERRLREEMESKTYLDRLLRGAFGRNVSVECRMCGKQPADKGDTTAGLVEKVRRVFPGTQFLEGGHG